MFWGKHIQVSISSFTLWLTIAFGLGVANPCTAQDPVAYPLSRTLMEGLPNAFVIVGNTAYVAAGTQMVILDITNPTEPVQVGSVSTYDEIKSIAVQGDFAFLANSESGLRIVDVGIPSQAEIVGTFTTQSTAYGVDVAGNFAYVGDRFSGMDIVDFSNPTSPALVSHFHLFDGPAEGQGVNQIMLRDSLAFVVDFHGITVLDVSNPYAPDSLSHYTRTVYNIDIRDSLVFVATNTAQRFESYVLDSTFHLRQLDALSLAGPLLDVKVAGNYAYVGCEVRGIACVDISDPENMIFVDRFNPDSLDLNVVNVAPFGNTVFACSHSYGVLVMDYSIPSAPVFETSLGYANYPVKMDHLGRSLYVANYYKGLTQIDISNFSYPVELVSLPRYGHYATTEGVSAFRRSDSSYAVVCDVDAGFRVINTTNSLAPYVVSATARNKAKGVLVEDDFAYVATGEGAPGFWIYDLTNLAAPLLRGSVVLTDQAEDVRIHENRAYVVNRFAGLKVIDISSPDSPVLVGTYPTGRVLDVELDFPYAYVTGPEIGLHVLDISTDTPQLIYQVEIDDAQGIDIDSVVAVVASGSGITILDRSNPENPTIAGTFPVEGVTTQIEIIQRKAIVSALFGGITIVDISEFYSLPRTSLIVAGGGNGPDNFDYFVRNTNPSTNDAFSKLADNRNYERPSVVYMNPRSWQDLYGDGGNDHVVDESNMTPESLRDAIGTLVDSNNPEFPNVIFLSGHGHVDEFDINGDPTQNVHADSLAAWIDRADLETNSKLVIIIEACNAGSMMDELSFGHPNRIVIVASGEPEVCNYRNGRSFSTELWAGIWRGQTLWAAFESARDWLDANNLHDQNPELNADGDSLLTSLNDRRIADSLIIGGDIQEGATLPVILDAPPQANMFNDTLSVTIQCNGAMERVWYRIFPDHYDGAPAPEALPNGYLSPMGDSYYNLSFVNNGSLNSSTGYLIEINALDDYVNLAVTRVVGLSVLTEAKELPVVPHSFELFQNYPNPFNSETRIRYSLSSPGRATIQVYDILGRHVTTLLDDIHSAGNHEVIWSGITDNGSQVATGLYFIALRSGRQQAVVKTLLLK